MRIKMAVALMAFTMNPQSCFLQTLTGLLCYAYGLRDKGFDILNVLGCTCGIDTIRKHGSYWAERRLATQELTPTNFWRLSIDNLNFKIKFAKSIGSGSAGAKKQLDLLTGQVNDRTFACRPHCTDSLKSAIFRHMEKEASTYYHTMHTGEDTFVLNMNSAEGRYLDQFRYECFATAVERMEASSLTFPNTFMESVQKHMKHWTPPKPDSIVYTTIDEASSASKQDIQLYLVKLKDELKIGQPGFPTKVVIAGDQQTFSIMWNLKKAYPNRFEWITVLHGDWHLMNLLSQVLRTLLWDGGLKQFAFQCGYKHELTQWQELHLMLMATHEVLLRKAVTEFKSQLHVHVHSTFSMSYGTVFWEWVDSLSCPLNKDQVSRFWASSLRTVNYYVGYYLSLRSLRNACLKAITPVFFAYSRDKYEQLCINVLRSIHTLPDDIIAHFLQGEWTTSLKGHKFRNLALDEAHESVINLRLKQITARPSHFRTVELSNFMAYLDKVVNSCEPFIFKNKV